MSVYFSAMLLRSFASVRPYHIGNSSKPVSIAVGSFNDDSNMDVIIADPGTNAVVILYGSGYGTFLNHVSVIQLVMLLLQSASPLTIFNKDGLMDIVCRQFRH